MAKPLKAVGVRVDVSRDGKETTLAFRDEAGRERDILLQTEDTSVLVAVLLATLSEVYNALATAPGGAPRIPPGKQSAIVRPLRVAIGRGQKEPVLVFDFGGAVVNLGIDAQVIEDVLARIRQEFQKTGS